MQYLHWLLFLSALVALGERVLPARASQRFARREILSDLAYLVFNGHLFAVLSGAATGWVALRARDGLLAAHALPERGWLDGQALVLQFGVLLAASDFLQWCVHNLLHRVPFLWRFHKVHHSVRDMDFLANFRFHWMEIVVYRSLLYVPTLWLGGDGNVLFAVAVFATLVGHLNHANLRLDYGPLAYIFNSPRMHLWHHDRSDEGGVAKNFGIVLSVWDWVFRTAYWPRDRAPRALGYPGDADMPAPWLAQLVFPFSRRRAPDS